MAVRTQTSRGGAARRAPVLAGDSRRRRPRSQAAIADFRLVQRDRIMLALAEIVEQLGMRALTVSEITARAGISRRTFYEHFADSEQALQATIDETLARAAARVVPAYSAQEDWREAIRAGLAALLAFLDQEPALGGLLLADALGRPFGDGPGLLLRRAPVAQALLDALDAGRALARAPAGLSPASAEGVLGGVLFILQARMQARKRAMSALLGELMSVIVRPYLGAAAAAREARRPAPAPAPSVEPAEMDGALAPRVDVRLTMRTVIVLRRIAEHPERSNREVAALAEIGDQGQASKLLARLASAGLIENVAGRSPAGRPNAWRLTAQGRRLTRTLGAGSSIRI